MKRWLTAALASAMTLAMAGLTACSDDAKKDVISLRVWGAQEDQALLGEMIDSFEKAHADKKYEITLGVVGEDNAQKRVLEDPNAAADIFSFPNDQIRTFVNAKALYEITRNREAVQNENTAASVEAATVDDKLYAYPMTSDNGYFLYYDSRVLSAKDVETLDGLMAAAQKAGRKVIMDVSDGWYCSSFFLGAGCKVGLDANGKQTCDFNNARGVQAAKAVQQFTAHPAFMTGGNDIVTGSMGSTACAAVSGTWNADALKEKLGDGYAAAKLPTFTLGDEQVQMGSFGGFKLLGVNALTAHPADAMELAEWLTNEQNQLLRFEKRAMGPSNRKAAENEKVKANAALAALTAQGEFASSQKDVLSTFWSPVEAFGLAMETKDYSKSLQVQLDAMVEQITR